jgi:hypothetical protein
MKAEDPGRSPSPIAAPAPGSLPVPSGGFKRFLSVFGLIAGLFFGGMFLGMRLADWLTPGSHFGKFVGFLMLPLSFGLGMTCWYWIANAVFFTRFFRAVWRVRKERDDFRKTLKSELVKFGDRAPSGTFVFVPISFALSSIAGALMGIIPGSRGILLTVPICSTLGLAYGLVVWRLARSGHLPIPEEA